MAFAIATGLSQETTFKVKSKKEKEKGERIEIKVKEGEATPMIIIDDKEYDSGILDIIDKDKIESVTVLKGEDALKKYGAKNGVILIKTKQKDYSRVNVMINSDKETEISGVSKRVKISVPEGTDAPVIIIDGKIKDRDVLDNISPDDIESIKVLKDEEAKKKYKTEAGVIIIKTKR
jgi:hypothetical protein